jgi:hypothetical protein
MKVPSWRLWALIACVVLGAVSARADRGEYVIESFDVTLQVEPSSALIVEERIVVEFSAPRHGIYRTIPVRYTDPRGYLYSLSFRLLGVVDDDRDSHQTQVTREGRYVKVRIGSPDETVQGRVVYTIRYLVRGALVHFAEHDELYWNATGNEWQTSIGSASARVWLPGAVPDSELETTAYTGTFGAREQAVTIERGASEGSSHITYRATRQLDPLEGLTVAAAWPHGLVQFPGPVKKAATFLGENWIVLLPLAAFAWLMRRYWSKGRDPEGAGAVVVRYEPPEEMTAGEIGAIVDERVDLRDITASVVDMAVRGHLRIRVDAEEHLFGLFTTEKTSFEKIDKPRNDLREYELRIFNGIFASGDVVSTEDLEHKFYKHIPKIRDDLWADLAARRFFDGKPNDVRKRWKIFGVVAAGATVGLGYMWASWRGAVFPHAMFLPIASGAFTFVLFVILSRAMPRRTPKGVASRNWALGFEEFVNRVERERLEADRQRNVFESLLPYAMALGVAAQWAREFEGIYATSPPAWFVGNQPYSGGGFSTSRFESSLSSAMAQTGSEMTSVPRSSGSSGFGGGGSSGGGGGGGGGGSW